MSLKGNIRHIILPLYPRIRNSASFCGSALLYSIEYKDLSVTAFQSKFSGCPTSAAHSAACLRGSWHRMTRPVGRVIRFPNPLPPEVETARWSCRRNHRLQGMRWWWSAGRTTKWGAQQDRIVADMSRSPVTIYKKSLSYAFVNLNKLPYNYANRRLHIQRPQNITNILVHLKESYPKN